MSSTAVTNDNTVIPLTIKWGKETLELSLPASTLTFKSLTSELEERTGVPVDRMKIMAKSKGLWKGVLKESMAVDWTKAVAANNGSSSLSLLLMGSATKLVKPATKTVFLEDLPPEEIAKVQEPSGLINLGNTCYMNSVVQCLRVVPALRHGLVQQQQLPPAELQQAYAANAADLSAFTTQQTSMNQQSRHQASFMLVAAFCSTLQRLDRQTDALRPLPLLQAMQMNFPQFAEMTSHPGHAHGPIPKQQDAEEFYSCLLAALADQTKHARVISQGLSHAVASSKNGSSNGTDTTTTAPEVSLDGATNLIDALFGMKIKSTLTCDEVPDGAEPPVVSYDLHRKLVCNIRGSEQAAAPASSADVAAAAAATAANASSSTSNINVTNIYEGLAVGLKGSIEKHSAVLGRNAIWTSIQRLERLPTILTVQFGRFFWKETPDSQDHTGVKCKVLKSVAFGSTLDIYDYCTPEVQAILGKARSKALAAEEERMNQKLHGKEVVVDQSMEDVVVVGDADAAAKKDENEMDEDEAALQAALAMSLKEGDENDDVDETLPPVGPGLPRNFQGHYELFAVVTHKGRDADGGHYMAWVKADTDGGTATSKIPSSNEDNEDWYVFDDDEVSPCKTEDVLKLKGGGDWHMSYLNFYRPKK